MKIQFLILLVAPFLCSCYTDKEELLYPDTGCDDLGNVSFLTDVTPLIESQCLACHSAANSASLGASIVLETYDDVTFGYESLGLLSAIKHESGSSPMPKSGSKMTDCEIKIIETWINEGGEDN